MILSLLAGGVGFSLFYGRMGTWALSACALFAVLLLWSASRAHEHSHDALTRIDLCANRSGLAQVSPGLKLGLFTGVLAATVAIGSPWFSTLVALTMGLICLGPGRVPARNYLSILTTPLAFVLMSGLALVFDLSQTASGVLNLPFFGAYLIATPETQGRALGVMLTAIGAVSCLFTLSLSTPLSEIIRVLRKLRVPELIIELMFLIYRYIFVLLKTVRSLKTAAASRLGFSRGALLRTTGEIMTSLLTASFRRAAAAFDAMESRCYDGSLRFFSREKPVKLRHLLWAAAYVLVLAGAYLTERNWSM